MLGKSFFVGEWVGSGSERLWLNEDGTFRLEAAETAGGNYYIEDDGQSVKLIHSSPHPNTHSSFTIASLKLSYNREADSLTAPDATRYLRIAG